jgi:hypothetical protein
MDKSMSDQVYVSGMWLTKTIGIACTGLGFGASVLSLVFGDLDDAVWYALSALVGATVAWLAGDILREGGR